MEFLWWEGERSAQARPQRLLSTFHPTRPTWRYSPGLPPNLSDAGVGGEKRSGGGFQKEKRVWPSGGLASRTPGPANSPHLTPPVGRGSPGLDAVGGGAESPGSSLAAGERVVSTAMDRAWKSDTHLSPLRPAE